MKTLLLAGAWTTALLALTAVCPLAGAEGNPSNQAPGSRASGGAAAAIAPLVFEDADPSFELHGPPARVARIPVADAADRSAVRLGANEDGWILQWCWPASRFVKDWPYRLSMRVRTAPAEASAADASVAGGIYRRFTLGKGETLHEFRAPVAADWQEVPVGQAVWSAMGGYVYVLTGPAPILVDHFIARPVVDDGNRDRFLAVLAGKEAEDARRAKQLENIRAGLRPHPELGDVFLFGTVVSMSEVLARAKLTGVPWEWELEQTLHDLKRHYGNFCCMLACDAVHPEMHPSAAIMEREKLVRSPKRRQGALPPRPPLLRARFLPPPVPAVRLVRYLSTCVAHASHLSRRQVPRAPLSAPCPQRFA